jgi:hypothetical protein
VWVGLDKGNSQIYSLLPLTARPPVRVLNYNTLAGQCRLKNTPCMPVDGTVFSRQLSQDSSIMIPYPARRWQLPVGNVSAKATPLPACRPWPAMQFSKSAAQRRRTLLDAHQTFLRNGQAWTPYAQGACQFRRGVCSLKRMPAKSKPRTSP